MENNQEINDIIIKRTPTIIILLLWEILITTYQCAAQTITTNKSEVDTINIPNSDEDSDIFFKGWTEERLRAYDDSLKNALYPPLATIKSSGNDEIGKLTNGDEGESTPARLISSSAPSSITIDKSKTVGEITIHSGVNRNGARTYEVPIEVYPGINGMTPKIAIVYDSQKGASALGYGWSLSGISSITRSGKSIYFDSKTEGIKYDTSDSFLLDGIRLVKTGSSTSFLSYETETGNIKAKGYIYGNVIKYFEVFYPDGRKGTFGYQSTTTNQLSYPLVKIIDLHGNAVDYTYTATGNHYRIDKITYNTKASILFSYSKNPSPTVTYVAGNCIREDEVISSIAAYFDSKNLVTYGMEYEVADSRTLLNEISLESDGQSYNPVKLFYGTGVSGSSFDSSDITLTECYVNDDPSRIKIVQGRFDSYSHTEGLIVLPENAPYWKSRFVNPYNRVEYFLFTPVYTGDEKLFIYPRLINNSNISPIQGLTTGKGFIDILCADIAGQQEEYIIKVNNVVSEEDDISRFSVYKTNVQTGMERLYQRSYGFPTVFTQTIKNEKRRCPHPKFYYAGDFNGDGRMEILAVLANAPLGPRSHPSRCYLFDLESDSVLFNGEVFEYNVEFMGTLQTDAKDAYNKTDKLLTFDYDGDGKTDICLISSRGTEIYTFDVNGSALTARLAATYPGLTLSSLSDRGLLCGEFNGDQLVDLLVSPKMGAANDKTWKVFYSRGDGSFVSTSLNGPANSSDSDTGFLLQDLDCDGMTDLIRYDKNGFDIYRWKDSAISSTPIRVTTSSPNSVVAPVNLTSHNSFFRMLSLNKQTVTKYSYKRNVSLESLVTGMANSLGVVEKNKYGMIDGSDASLYHAQSNAVFPYVGLLEQIPVIAESEIYLSGKTTEKKAYYYENAVMHRQGLGFLGFTKVKESGNHIFEREYDPCRHGIPTSDKSPDIERSYTYDISFTANKIARINLKKKIEKDILRGNTSTTTYTCDAYGYPTQETTVYSDGVTVRKDKTYSSSAAMTDGYNLGFLTDSKETTTTSAGSFISRVHVPSHEKRRAKTKIEYVDGNKIVEHAYTYDSHGNLTSASDKNYTATGSHTATYTYDAYGRLTGEKDHMGLSTTYTYDGKGRLASMKSPRGGSTTYIHDAFGRESSRSYPDGTVESVSRSWDSSSVGLYSIKRQSTGKPEITEIYDAMNRIVRTTDKRFDGTSRNVDRQYDGYGRLYKKSVPFKGTTAAGWDIYTYDSHDRPISVTRFSGSVTTWSYSGNYVTTEDGGVSIKRGYSPRGDLLSSEDLSGTVTYTIAPDGQPSKVTMADGAVTSFTYDKYRRQTSITDPSAGKMSYEYDAEGNISKETDANGGVTNFSYDSYNRLTKKINSEFSTTYTYNTYGDLTKMSSDNGTSTETAYDSFGRVTSIKETAPGTETFKRVFTYSAGNVKTIEYHIGTSHVGTENLTYSNGYLKTSDLDGTQTIYTKVGENNLGQTTFAHSGPDRTYSYTPSGIPAGRKAAVDGRTIQDFLYSINPTTLSPTSRKDIKRGLTESFGYDGLNRLTSYSGNTATYAANGNLTSKSEVGTFAYGNTGKPYALTSVTTEGTLIPSATQAISFTTFSRPAEISENGKTATFLYDGNYDRRKMTLKSTGKTTPDLVRYYMGGCYERDEKADGTVTDRIYLNGGYYDAPAVLIREKGVTKLHFILRDYLGSITAVVGPDKSIVQELSYDAWGNLRNPATQKVYSQGEIPELLLGRGYTGHEHLPWFGLVNMNARLYDPVVGRFISPDPFVQLFDFSQNYNRFAYCLNNPMLYNDKDGKFFWAAVIVGAVIITTGVFEVVKHWDSIKNAGIWMGTVKTLFHFGIGVVASTISLTTADGSVGQIFAPHQWKH